MVLFNTWNDSSVGKESACNAGDPSLISGLGRSPGERIGYMFQYSWASLLAQLVKNPPAFRKMVMITLYVRQQKRHRCIEQSFGLCGRGRGRDDLGGWHWNMYNIRNKSPVQVLCRIQDAWGWCTGMTQRDGMGREVGAGFRMGNTCTPVVDPCMAKPLEYCKVISLQLNKWILKI